LKLKQRAADLVNGGLKILLVSMDGWDEESQKKRGLVPNSFAAIVKGIAEVKRLRGRSPFPIIRINSVITKVNYHSVDKMAEAVYEMGARHWSLQNYYFMTDGAMDAHKAFKRETGIGDKVMQHHIPGADSYFDPGEVRTLKDALSRTRTLLSGRLRGMRVDFDWDLDLDKFYSPRPPSRASSCDMPFNRVDIHTDGRIAVCGDGHTIGNINDGTVGEAWDGEENKRFRGVLGKHKVMPMCFRCCGIVNSIKFDDSPAPRASLVNIAMSPAS